MKPKPSPRPWTTNNGWGVSPPIGARIIAESDREHAIASGQRTLAIAVRLGIPLSRSWPIITWGWPTRSQATIDRRSTSSRKTWCSSKELLHEFFGVASLPAIGSRVWLVDCLAELGAFTEGIARGEEAIQIAEAVDHFNSLILAYWGLGAVYLRQGELLRALPCSNVP